MPAAKPAAVAIAALAALAPAIAPGAAEARNLIIFVADGLRSRIVTPETAPAIAALRREGVDFQNSHSLYPTVTTPNASAIATGHALGDTGDFGNTIYVGKAFPPPYGVSLVGLEDDVALGLMNQRHDGNYLGEVSLLAAARTKGYATAVVGKLGPAAIQDVTVHDGAADGGIVIDDMTGDRDSAGLALAPDIVRAIKAAGLSTTAPDRGLNTSGGAYNLPGTWVANVDQQAWFAGVATKVLLPRFKAEGKPFVMVYWSRDPDGTQHNEGDSLNTLEPGVNGPTAMAGIRNASNNLEALREALKAQGLDGDTDIIVTADHGFSTMSRQSQTSFAAKLRYPDVVPGFLPQGFTAIDLAHDLGLKLLDAAAQPLDAKKGFYPKKGAILAADPARPEVVLAPNGGSVLIYLPGPDAKALAPRIVEALTRQDYTGGLFVNDDLGPIPGTLPMSRVGLIGTARTPTPAIVVSFKSLAGACADPEICGIEIADADQQQGQGTHGGFGRQDTHNFMAAVGPDFKAGFVDTAPVSNADWAVTAAHILGIDMPARGQLTGRVMAEALASGGPPPETKRLTLRSEPAANGFVTVLDYQEAAGRTYYDAAGMPGRTIGLRP